jgi:hypothetical protein
MDRSEAVGRDCVIVAKGQKSLDELAPYFASVQPVDDPRLAACGPYRVAIAHDLLP